MLSTLILSAHIALLIRKSFLERTVHRRSTLASWKKDILVSIYTVWRHNQIACNFFPCKSLLPFQSWCKVFLQGKKLRMEVSKDHCLGDKVWKWYTFLGTWSVFWPKELTSSPRHSNVPVIHSFITGSLNHRGSAQPHYRLARVTT